MKVRFLKPAQAEVDDAFTWYETQTHGLGMQFLDDFDRAIRRIVAYPFASTEIDVSSKIFEALLRRCLF